MLTRRKHRDIIQINLIHIYLIGKILNESNREEKENETDRNDGGCDDGYEK